MNFEPLGYYILIEMEEVEKKIEEFIEGSMFIAPVDVKKKNEQDNERDQAAHDVGVVKAFGNLSFTGFRGVDDDASVTDRAAQYGVKVGDKVEFNRYDGKIPRDPEFANFRCIQDEHIIGRYYE
jgi:co-chaperonin GroES (HSP10)